MDAAVTMCSLLGSRYGLQETLTYVGCRVSPGTQVFCQLSDPLSANGSMSAIGPLLGKQVLVNYQPPSWTTILCQISAPSWPASPCQLSAPFSATRSLSNTSPPFGQRVHVNYQPPFSANKYLSTISPPLGQHIFVKGCAMFESVHVPEMKHIPAMNRNECPP
jgi:hypothetical protein